MLGHKASSVESLGEVSGCSILVGRLHPRMPVTGGTVTIDFSLVLDRRRVLNHLSLRKGSFGPSRARQCVCERCQEKDAMSFNEWPRLQSPVT